MHASPPFPPFSIAPSEELKHVSFEYLDILAQKVYSIMNRLASELDAIRQNYQESIFSIQNVTNTSIKNLYTCSITIHDHIYTTWKQAKKLYNDIQKEISMRIWEVLSYSMDTA